jgi:5-methyltetrahydropteroyltriglutamate--homocysteine methyltransferase
LITASTGGFSRIGEGIEGQKLRRAYSRIDRGEISHEELMAIEGEVTSEVIYIQDEAGVELLTDGQIRWHDPVSYFMGKLPGVEIGPLARFFDTNTYYRQPIIREKISRQKPVTVDEFLFAQSITPKPVKPVLTGPVTLAKLSINEAHGSDSELIETLGSAIAQEVEALARAGAIVIQIDEPVILQNPQDIKILHIALEAIARHKGDAELALYTYFGDAAQSYEKLQQLPVDILGLDFTYSPNLAETIIAIGTDMKLGLGLIDGRNTKMETEADVFPLLESLLALPRMDSCYLNPSCGLEYLPRTKATAKLKNMVDLRDKFQGGVK